LLPGLQHCEGGSGFTEFDSLSALEAWVETGAAPDVLPAESPALGLAREICAYPARTVHAGGDPADPASFACE
jgi:feruloyl esterase